MAKKCLRQKSTPITEHLILSLWRISALSCFLFPDKEVFFINKKKGPQGKKANFRTWKLPPHPTPQPSKKNFLKMGFFCSFIFHLWYFLLICFSPPGWKSKRISDTYLFETNIWKWAFSDPWPFDHTTAVISFIPSIWVDELIAKEFWIFYEIQTFKGFRIIVNI